MKTTKKQNRIFLYDWVRLLATIWVVIGHSAYLDDAQKYGSVAYSLPENLSPVYNSAPLAFCRFLSGFAYTFHMPLFFMLSGAVLCYGIRAKQGGEGKKAAGSALPSFDGYIIKKVRRLWLPYLVCGYLFMLPVKYLTGYYNAETFPQALAGFLIGEDAGHLWFLPALFWSLLIFMAILKLCGRFNCKSLFAPLLICFLISFSYTLCPIEVFQFKTGLDYLIWVGLGYAFEQLRANRKPLSKKTLFALLLLMLLLEVLHKKYLILHYLAAIVVGCFLTYLVARLLEAFFPKAAETKGFSLISRNLFMIYLIHDPLEFVILKLCFRYGWLTTGAGCYAYTLLRTVGVFVISLAAGELLSCLKKSFSRSGEG